jgi:predicted alpha-1,2-mannosidase
MPRRFEMVLMAALTFFCAPIGRGEADYTKFVDPFIGTGGHGHTYPGASLPFGMVQLSPDTRLTGWDGCSGYHYSDSTIYGFSHTHLSGTGCSDYGDILLMPTVGEVLLDKGEEQNPESGYCSRFRHESESASPGYYRVHLNDDDIAVELTVTKRAGFHRYTFPKSDKSNVIIDLTHRDRVLDSQIRFVSDTEIAGFRRSSAWAQDQHVYFVSVFSKPFLSSGIAVDDTIREGLKEASGENIKAFVTFHTDQVESVLVKVGLSAVNTEGARRNLETEIPDWDFEGIRKQASDEWNRALGKIHLEGGTEEQRTIFYTSLYHALLNPNLYMDVDGRYRGRDLTVHQSDNFDYYTVFSLWDTYRATHPLFTILESERTVDFIKTFLAQYDDGGMLPVWELAANETGCMIGYHSVSVIADAYLKDLRDFDVEKAFEAMKHSAEQDHLGLQYYKESGYIPADREGESVSKTLEYAYDDWCIAQMAQELGRMDDYERYIRRAQSYKNIFDPETGFMRAKMNGSWITPFDPREVNFYYTEANAWQYSFSVSQDITGLIKLMGGKEGFSRKLDDLFATASKTTGRQQVDITGMIGQYAHGNEPSHHMAYLYNYAGQPWKTQQRVREIMDGLYTTNPDGLCGNEDCGQMSAWYIFSALGFYPVTPGQDVYIIGTPLFPQASIDVGTGKRFVVRANDVSPKNMYIQSATLNGQSYARSSLRHADIMSGGELVFHMGPDPNKTWGSRDDDIPVSSIPDHVILPVPFITAPSRTFTDSMDIAMGSPTEEAEIYYTTDGTEPSVRSILYTEPFCLSESTMLKIRSMKNGFPPSALVTAEFSKIPGGRNIKLNTSYSPLYCGGGDMALIDHIRGSDDFRTGSWQGYQGVDLDAIVDLGDTMTVHRITTGFLQDQGSWIFMPVEVEYAVSTDGKDFKVVATLENDIPPEQEGAVIKELTKDNLNLNARYVRVRAKNRGVCPDWHRGAGGKAWLFMDEIIVE